MMRVLCSLRISAIICFLFKAHYRERRFVLEHAHMFFTLCLFHIRELLLVMIYVCLQAKLSRQYSEQNTYHLARVLSDSSATRL